jgi:hypothetical protein
MLGHSFDNPETLVKTSQYLRSNMMDFIAEGNEPEPADEVQE